MVNAVGYPSLLKLEFHGVKGSSFTAQFGTHVWKNVDTSAAKRELAARSGCLENPGLVGEIVQAHYHCSGSAARAGLRSEGTMSAIQYH